MFIGLLRSIVSASKYAKSVSLIIKKAWLNILLLIYIIMIIVKDYYPFAVDLDTCVGSCNILNNLSNKECVPNKK